MSKSRTALTRTGRWPAFALLIAALAARLLVPAGFMPVATAHGVRLVFCSGHGPMTMPGHEDPGHNGHDAPCGFAALADAAAGGGDSPALAHRPVFALARLDSDFALQPVRRPERLRPPLRAPPVPTFA